MPNPHSSTFDPILAYRQMYYIRCVEDAIAHEYPQGEMRCPVHFSQGQEAAAVGTMMALRPTDHVFASHRSHAPYLAKGGSLDALLAELYGLGSGCTGGWGGSMYLSDPDAGFIGSYGIVGSCVAVATGAALGFKLSGSDQVAVAYFGDATLETGQFWESLNFAALHQLPILYICENNRYASQTPLHQRQPSVSMGERVRPWTAWDGCVPDSDVEAVWVEASWCRAHLPAFLEIQTYRFRGHVGPGYDWHMGYRSREEVKAAMANDPLVRLREQLDEASHIEDEARLLVDRTLARVKLRAREVRT